MVVVCWGPSLSLPGWKCVPTAQLRGPQLYGPCMIDLINEPALLLTLLHFLY